MSETNSTPVSQPGTFGWNELLSTDVDGAKKFYTDLFGWSCVAFGTDYTLFNKGDNSVGGLMKTPKPGMPAHWLAYVVVEDVDITAGKVTGLGGQVMAPPFDIPNVGRIAIVADPQGATLGLFKPASCTGA